MTAIAERLRDQMVFIPNYELISEPPERTADVWKVRYTLKPTTGGRYVSATDVLAALSRARGEPG